MFRQRLRTPVSWCLIFCLLSAPSTWAGDVLTHIRKHPKPAECPPTMRGMAQLVTALENDLRKYGSITLKEPDIWGESTLMSMVQEYDRLMVTDTEKFKESIQGFVARADQAGLQAQAALAVGASGGSTPLIGSVSAPTSTSVVDAGLMAPPGTPFDLLDKSVASKIALSLEPTENTRQHSVYLKVNQALRRTNLGDDNSRQEGYSAYLLRFPVSILPGRETHRGCAAVITLRARLDVDDSNLRDMFPRLAVADLISVLRTWLTVHWEEEPAELAVNESKGGGPDGRIGFPLEARDPLSIDALYSNTNLAGLLELAHKYFGRELGVKPKAAELEDYLFNRFMSTHGRLTQRRAYTTWGDSLLHTADAFSKGCLEEVARTREQTQTALEATLMGAPCDDPDSPFEIVAGECANRKQAQQQAMLGWLLLAQSALLDYNTKQVAGTRDCPTALQPLGAADELAQIHFFEPDGPLYPPASAAWKRLIEAKFPVHLFTVDPVIEEQNFTDAFSRRRELQLAMAIAVAKGEMSGRAAMRFTRQLSLDMLAVGLNRTSVAFAHDNDTFGWYFYPRLQSPPEERSNLMAMARLLWSGGPTRMYDLKHRELEPGMRECEAVIVMPSFVPFLKIDVTTNWERLAHPGSIKVDYVKMINQARSVQKAICYSNGVRDQNCYRPVDYEVLSSRIEQLGKMLPLQQQRVRVPFPYLIQGAELFDSGNKFLKPSLSDFYGLEFLPCDPPGKMTAYMFITGRHFHPTMTHLIAGGVKSDTLEQNGSASAAASNAAKADTVKGSFELNFPKDFLKPAAAASAADPAGGGSASSGGSPKLPTDVTVINRELIRVKIGSIPVVLNDSCIDVYVSTPSGLSNRLRIPLQGGCQDACKPRAVVSSHISGVLDISGAPNDRIRLMGGDLSELQAGDPVHLNVRFDKPETSLCLEGNVEDGGGATFVNLTSTKLREDILKWHRELEGKKPTQISSLTCSLIDANDKKHVCSKLAVKLPSPSPTPATTVAPPCCPVPVQICPPHPEICPAPDLPIPPKPVKPAPAADADTGPAESEELPSGTTEGPGLGHHRLKRSAPTRLKLEVGAKPAAKVAPDDTRGASVQPVRVQPPRVLAPPPGATVRRLPPVTPPQPIRPIDASRVVPASGIMR